MASSASSARGGGPLEWLTGLSPNDARLIVAGLAVVAAGRVAWDLVVYDWLFPPPPASSSTGTFHGDAEEASSRVASPPVAVNHDGVAMPERHRSSMLHLPNAASSRVVETAHSLQPPPAESGSAIGPSSTTAASTPGKPEAPTAEKKALVLEAFNTAAAALSAGALESANLNNDQQLHLYALYKQVTAGDCPEGSAPWSMLDPTASAKHSAWSAIRGLADSHICAMHYSLAFLSHAGAVAESASARAAPGRSVVAVGAWPMVLATTSAAGGEASASATTADDKSPSKTATVVAPSGVAESVIIAYKAAWAAGIVRTSLSNSEEVARAALNAAIAHASSTEEERAMAVAKAARGVGASGSSSSSSSSSSSGSAAGAAARGMATPPSTLADAVMLSPAQPSTGALSADQSALEEAVRNGDTNGVRAVLQGSAANRRRLARTILDSDGTSVLLMAAESGNCEVAELLLDAGADAAAASTDGITPMHSACSEADVNMCALLLRAGATFDCGEDGDTPLSCLPDGEVAAAEGKTAHETFRELVEAKM